MTTTLAIDDLKHSVIAALLATTEIREAVGDNVYPNVLPADVLHRLAIVVNKVDSEHDDDVLTGPTGRKRTTIQVDCYGDNSVPTTALAKLVKLRLLNHGRLLGDMPVNHVYLVNDFDMPPDAPSDKTDRWRFRCVIRVDIEHCEDTE